MGEGNQEFMEIANSATCYLVAKVIASLYLIALTSVQPARESLCTSAQTPPVLTQGHIGEDPTPSSSLSLPPQRIRKQQTPHLSS